MNTSDIELVIVYGAPDNMNQLHQVQNLQLIVSLMHVFAMVSYVSELEKMVEQQELMF